MLMGIAFMTPRMNPRGAFQLMATSIDGASKEQAVAYSAAFKSDMMAKMMAPGARPVEHLAIENGVGPTTLSRWKLTAMMAGMKNTDNKKRRPDVLLHIRSRSSRKKRLAVLVVDQHERACFASAVDPDPPTSQLLFDLRIFEFPPSPLALLAS